MAFIPGDIIGPRPFVYLFRGPKPIGFEDTYRRGAHFPAGLQRYHPWTGINLYVSEGLATFGNGRVQLFGGPTSVIGWWETDGYTAYIYRTSDIAIAPDIMGQLEPHDYSLIEGYTEPPKSPPPPPPEPPKRRQRDYQTEYQKRNIRARLLGFKGYSEQRRHQAAQNKLARYLMNERGALR